MESGALLSLPPLQSSAWHGGSQAGTRLQLQPRNPERRGWPGGGSRGYRSPPHPLPELQPNPTALAALPFWRPLATLLLDPSRLATSHGEGAPLSSSLGSALHPSRLSGSAGGSSSSFFQSCCLLQACVPEAGRRSHVGWGHRHRPSGGFASFTLYPSLEIDRLEAWCEPQGSGTDPGLCFPLNCPDI